ncbi:bluetail domain-containing putative surface protein [Dolichospermum sp. UHCC 0260]|uniref:bluetail domain-containing putative surface protein n=1 Tax=unclassified Dolichospermum TaxID=2622029 RepID=UPI00352ADBE2
MDGAVGDQFVFGAISNDNLSGGSGNDILDGLDGNDTLDARDGNDILQGGSGNDTLTGGTGNDNFVFNSPRDEVDTITDFENGGIDQIVISAKGFGGGLTPDAFLQQSQFVLGTTAADGDDRFIYDPATGNLFFDPDGTGDSPQQLIATLAGAPNLSASDIFISGNSTTPSIQITAPDTNISGKEVAIEWNAFDADSQAQISLFYDTDDQGLDGVLIADGLAETDGQGSFIWNTENVPQEDYFIYAKIVDETHSPVFSYAKGQIKLKLAEEADLSVTQTASATSVGLGETLTYTIKVTNNGLVASKGVTLVETLPEEVTFTSASLTPSEQTDNVLTFDLGDLAAGNSETITINITTSALITGTITSDAVVLSQTLDPDITQNVSSVSTEVIAPALPDLTITRIDASGAVGLKAPYSYNLIITNNGSIAATGVVLTDNLPSDVNYISTNTTVPLRVSGSIVTGNLGTVNPGESKTVNLSLASFVAGNLIGTTKVTSNETDSNPLDNLIVSRKTVSSTAPSPADLTLMQTVDNLNPNTGSQVTFTLTLTNKGPNIASGIQVTDLLPNGLSFISATPEQGTYDYKTGVWDVGNMKNNLSRTLKLVAKVNQGGVIVNKTELTAANEPDPNSTPGNNNPNEDDQAVVTIVGNRTPTDILLTKKPASGNLPIGTILGTFSSTDPDTGNTFTYSLVNGLGNTSNSLFTIVGNQLKTNIPLDTAQGFDFSIRVRTTDQGNLFFDKIIEIKKISGGGWGDVHLRTFDGLWYDQQSFGDFILVKSTVDDWQIQTRQNPWIYNSNVSVNTAFATTVDGHRVLFDKFLDDGKKLKIDGNQVTLTSGESLTIGNSKISRQGNSYTLIYAGQDGILSTGDDDQLIASDNESYVDINVLPSNGRAGLLQGFLGNADGIISNEFTLRSGTLLSSNPTWEQIHGVWAESWRVPESESLFTTPSPFQGTPPKITLSDLDAKDVQDAIDAGIKLGLPDAALYAAALDFALTKDITFLNNAANLFSPKFSISSSSIAEGDKDSSSVRLFVKLSTSSKRTVTVDYATQDGTGLNKAIAGSDYTATSGTLTFLPGTTALTVDIPILGDTNIESDESFLVNLTNPYGAILATSQSTINILNDDLTLVPTFAGTSSNDVFTGGDGNDIINGEGGDDSLNGGAGDDTLNGGPGKDVLTGGSGKDVFVYNNFTDSLFANPDRIRSFNPSEGDRIDLANVPTATFNAGNISALNLTAAVIAAYADADPTLVGAQALAVNQAVFFSFGATPSTRRTYLAVNDSSPDYNSGNDLFIEVTGIVGTLPSGSLASQSYFI